MPAAHNALHKAVPVVGIMLLALGLLALLARVVAVDLELFVLAALLPVVASRLPHPRSGAVRVRDGAIVAVASVVAVELPVWIAGEPAPGMAALIACAVASKWLRGRSRSLGITAAGAGLAVRLALISLVAPGASGAAAPRMLLAVALVALVFLCWAAWTRVRADLVPAPIPAAARATQHAARRAQRRSSTLQMLLAFSLACVLGRWLFGAHWNWAALSAFLVLTGPLNRAEVLEKGLHRLVGAVAGTVAAAVLARFFGAADRWTLAALLVVAIVSIALRRVVYAGWVAGITAALSLLYSYEGQDAGALLGVRLMALATGAVLAIATGWFVQPLHAPEQSTT